MISIYMTGDYRYTDFASTKEQLSRKFRAARIWLQREGYQVVESWRGGFIAESYNGRVHVSIEKLTPKGVRT